MGEGGDPGLQYLVENLAPDRPELKPPPNLTTMQARANVEQFNAGLLDEELQFGQEGGERRRGGSAADDDAGVEDERTGHSARLTEKEADEGPPPLPADTLDYEERGPRSDRDIQAKIKQLEAERRNLRLEREAEEERLGLARGSSVRMGKEPKGREYLVNSRGQMSGWQDPTREHQYQDWTYDEDQDSPTSEDDETVPRPAGFAVRPDQEVSQKNKPESSKLLDATKPQNRPSPLENVDGEADFVDDDGAKRREEHYLNFLAEQKEKTEKERAEEKEVIEKFDHEMRERLSKAEYTDPQIETMMTKDHEDEEREKKVRDKAPVYSKVHTKYLSLATLEYYDLPWEYDRVGDTPRSVSLILLTVTLAQNDPNYIIITRELDKDEIEVLFEHTRILQAGGTGIHPRPGEQPKKFVFRKRTQ